MPKAPLLFSYALLKPEYEKHHKFDLKNPRPDTIFGDLYDLGDDGAAVRLGKSIGKVKGYVWETTDEQLKKLDVTEKKDFRRIKVKTWLGRDVYAYEYEKAIPKDAKKVFDWHKK